MNSTKLESIRIDPGQRRRSQGSYWAILLGVLFITAVGA